MLYESQVIEGVCNWLTKSGFRIDQKLNERQRGQDVIALKGRLKVIVEAKGGTSSNPESNRFGLPFDVSQVRDHVSVALFQASAALTEAGSNSGVKVAVAFPDNKDHRRIVALIESVLSRLKVGVFWVNDEGRVSEIQNWNESF